VRFIGFSGYPQKIFRFLCDQAAVDCVLSYNQYTLQNTPFVDEDRALSEGEKASRHQRRPVQRPPAHVRPLPAWLQGTGKRSKKPRAPGGAAGALRPMKGVDIGHQTRVRNSSCRAYRISPPTIAGSAHPVNNISPLRARWLAGSPLDAELLAPKCQTIFKPGAQPRPRRGSAR
jgi:hypothetical protein